MGLLLRLRLGVLVHTGLVLVLFECGMGQRQLGIVAHAEHIHSFVDCVVACAAYAVVELDSVVVAARCIAGTQQIGVHVESRRGWLVLCRCRRGRALARCFVFVVLELPALGGAQAQVDGWEVVVRLMRGAACMVLSTARMRA